MHPFLERLSQIRGGSELNKAEAKMRELVQEVLDVGKAGFVNIRIVVEPDKGDELLVSLKPKATSKLPERECAKGLFFVDKQGNLTREDPRQLELLAEQEAEREAKREAERAAGIAHLDRIGRG